jgi:hypothetical protein
MQPHLYPTLCGSFRRWQSRPFTTKATKIPNEVAENQGYPDDGNVDGREHPNIQAEDERKGLQKLVGICVELFRAEHAYEEID